MKIINMTLQHAKVVLVEAVAHGLRKLRGSRGCKASKIIRTTTINFTPVSDRITIIELQATPMNINLMQIYTRNKYCDGKLKCKNWEASKKRAYRNIWHRGLWAK